MASLGQSLFRLAQAALKAIASRPRPTRSAGSVGRTRPAVRLPGRAGAGQRSTGHPAADSISVGSYSPRPGMTADPGEIVWTWVPFEDDPGQGKDRPVLIIGRDSGVLLALMLTSRDRNNAENRHEGYVDIGSGPWDRQGRPSEVYVKRLLRIDEQDVRRIGATLDRPLFDRVMSHFDAA